MSEITQNPVINQTPNSSTPVVYYLADGVGIFGCLGSPEGAIAADPGSMAFDVQSSPAVAYLKETGSGNTGWQPFQSGSSGVTGSGALNQNTFWTGASTISGNNSWIYNNTTKAVTLSDNSNLPILTVSRTTATDPSKIYAGVPSYLELRAFDSGDGGTGKLSLVGGASGPGYPLSGNVSAQILFGSTDDPALAGAVLGGSIKCIATENIGVANGGHGFTWSSTPNGSTSDTSVININKYGILQLGSNGTQPSAELSGSGQPFTVVIGNLSTYNTDTAVQIGNPAISPTTEKTLVVQANPSQTASIIETQSSGGGGQFQVRVIPGVTQHFLSLLGTSTAPALSVAGQWRMYCDNNGLLQLSENGGAYSSLVKSSGGNVSGALTITSNSANALAVGPNGTINPVLKIDGSVASQATGLEIKGNAAGSGVTLTVLSSGSNEDIGILSKGAGTIALGVATASSGRVAIAGTPVGTVSLLMAPTGLSSNDQLISQQPSSVTGNLYSTFFSGSVTQNLIFRLQNNENASGVSNASLQLYTGGSSAGDPHVNFEIAAGANWSIGIDNSDSDKLKIGFASTPSAGNTVISFDTSGDITLSDGTDVILNTTTGSKIATSVSQKLGFWNATPVVQPASANQAALTDSTGGTADGTVADVGVVFNQATLNNNFADIIRLLNQLRNDLTTIGIIKGAA